MKKTWTSLWVGVLAAGAILCGQLLTVEFRYGGDWRALYYTGADLPFPPQLESEHATRFPGDGYDGQFYHYIAHDPLFRHGLAKYVDDPGLRYRRILVPVVAGLLAGGDTHHVDAAYVAEILLWVLLGAWWLSLAAVRLGRSAYWGLGFLAVPAVVISADRLVADVALAALSAAFALTVDSGDRRHRRLYAVLVLAPLVRETGVLLIAAASLWAAGQRQWRRALVLASTALPCLAWYGFVYAHTTAAPYPVSLVPLSGIASAFIHPLAYADRTTASALLSQLADRLALVGVVLAFGICLSGLRKVRGPVELAGILWSLLGLFLQRRDHWKHVYDFGRVYSPVLLFLGIRYLESNRRLTLVPTVLMTPRLALQVGSHVKHVVAGLSRALS